MGRLKIKDLKMEDQKDETVWKAGPENEGPNIRTWKCGTTDIGPEMEDKLLKAISNVSVDN